MRDNPYFDDQVLSFTSDRPLDEVVEHLAQIPDLKPWGHIVVVFPESEFYAVIRVGQFTSMFEGMLEKLKSQPLAALANTVLTAVRALDPRAVDRVSPERLLQLSREEPAGMFIVVEAGEVLGRIWDPDRGGVEEDMMPPPPPPQPPPAGEDAADDDPLDKGFPAHGGDTGFRDPEEEFRGDPVHEAPAGDGESAYEEIPVSEEYEEDAHAANGGGGIDGDDGGPRASADEEVPVSDEYEEDAHAANGGGGFDGDDGGPRASADEGAPRNGGDGGEAAPGDDGAEGTAGEWTGGESAGGRRISTYPNIRSGDHAVLENTFTVRVKLSDQEQADTGGHLHAPAMNVSVDEGVKTVPVEISLYAPDFGLAPENAEAGLTRTVELFVAARSSGEAVFHLLAEDRLQPRYFSTLRFTFRIHGIVVGQAMRRVEVLESDAVEPTPVPAFPPITFPVDAERTVMTTPAENIRLRMPDPRERPVDLHVTITENEGTDRLDWVIDAPALGGEGRREASSRNLSAENWVRRQLGDFIRAGMRRAPAGGEFTRVDGLRFFGLLITLRDAAPDVFWEAYSEALEAHELAGKPPETFTILFVTEDPHLPWELMPVSRDQRPGGKPPHLLGSAHRVGRWLLGLEAGSPMPALNLHGLSLAVPDYRKELPGTQAMKTITAPWRPFLIGERDGAFDPEAFFDYMSSGQPTGGTGILHYAGHGDCCKDNARLVWLMLSDQDDFYDYYAARNPMSNALAEKGGDVFVFFNACTAGQAAETELGTTASWSQVMLSRGYDGYVGPLWYVDDGYAKNVAEQFYLALLGPNPVPIGEAMRRIRANYINDLSKYTYIAYSYYGHPNAEVNFTPFSEQEIN